MTDIVERMRVYIRFEHPKDYETHVVWQAADEIDRLRMALLQIAGKVSQSDKSFDGDMASEIARAALGEGKE
jgi:hypothetical protein